MFGDTLAGKHHIPATTELDVIGRTGTNDESNRTPKTICLKQRRVCIFVIVYQYWHGGVL